MNERSIKYATFVMERNYSASPERVFAAWSDPSAKSQWYPKADEREHGTKFMLDKLGEQWKNE